MKLSILDCGKSKSVREAETVNFVVGTDEDIDKVGVTHSKDELVRSVDRFYSWKDFFSKK